MINDYIVAHLQLGSYIRNLMEKSSLFSMEFSLTDMEITLICDFTNNKGDVINWYEKPEELITIFDFCPKELIYKPTSKNFKQLNEEFFNLNPLLADKKFLVYLSQFMNFFSNDDTYYIQFTKNSIGDDINIFWGKNIKSFLFNNELQKKLAIENLSLCAEKGVKL